MYSYVRTYVMYNYVVATCMFGNNYSQTENQTNNNEFTCKAKIARSLHKHYRLVNLAHSII